MASQEGIKSGESPVLVSSERMDQIERLPTEDDYETIKLISNGAFGYAYYLITESTSKFDFIAIRKLHFSIA